MAEQSKTREISGLPASAREKLDAKMARLLTINVLAAFHTSKPVDMPMLYEWKPGCDSVRISSSSHAFLIQHAQALELIANFYWAEFLENCNRLAPRIVQKVARDAARRGSLAKYLKILMNETALHCFYCEGLFGEKTPTVDHVIPWSFLLEEGLWDLVLACAKCNGAKSDLLPSRNFIDKLIDRNRKLSTAGISLGISDVEITRLYEAAISVEWPGFWHG
ncbi:MAG TPA: HNH endonuclease domain-containing protein [Candidatus Cybelea sp.]